MAVFTLFFGKLAKIPSEGVPYAIFVYTGLLYWIYFSTALTNASNSFIENENIIKKVYFPRLIIPLANSITPIVDFALSFLIIFLLMFFYHFKPNYWGILMIFPLIVVTFICSIGLGLLLASINVKYRDVKYILGFLTQVLFYVTPVIYPASFVPHKFQWLIYLNPIAGVITLARGTMLGHNIFDWKLLLISLSISLFFLAVGIIYFRKTERFIADII
jgi:lipopolysaccharide transport system permease protein